ASLRQNGAEVHGVLRLLQQAPEELRHAVSGNPEQLFNFDCLQRRPLIKARPSQVIAPVMSLVLRQLLTFPLQVIAGLDGGARVPVRQRASWSCGRDPWLTRARGGVCASGGATVLSSPARC